MIVIDQLRISDHGTEMYIDVHVNQASYFDNFYLDSIVIMTADKVSEGAPELFTDDYICKIQFQGDFKEAHLRLTPSDCNENFAKSDFSHDLFFVYIVCKCNGTPDPCIPCRLDELTTVGVTFDDNLLYQRVMDYTKQLGNDCQVPQGFVDFILLWNAFKASVETEHWTSAIKFYNLLFGGGYGTTSYSTVKLCGCHG